ncbi:transmembrane protein 154 isoform X1 [Neomonachus schauinslandi]|uniref:Transmembrane protein 154 isoform X1 n=1 Tax=Neomonachus schauinslandi TaxID=29088 RepID=A0A2Y9HS92_NEOSC|nr:transmembrane protein 154 isoform X1 [Neomonachus schauinslandi]
MPGRRADRKAPRAALAFALVIMLLPTSLAQEKNMTVLKTANEDPLASFYFSEETEQSAEMPLEEESRDENFHTQTTFVAVTMGAFMANSSFSDIDEDENQLEFILMVLIPLVLFALLFLAVIILVVRYKRKRTKQGPSSQGSQSAVQTCELGSENNKVPIFEEDTPSVMEIEMEELDKWMNSMNRNADCECLPTLKEEKESNHNPSDSES